MYLTALGNKLWFVQRAQFFNRTGGPVWKSFGDHAATLILKGRKEGGTDSTRSVEDPIARSQPAI